MADWTAAELERIAAADDFYISPFRKDGVTPGTPTWIWSVVVDGAVYVRAYNGTASRWYRSAMARQAGRVRVAGIGKDVAFAPVAGGINDRIDDAYRAKYATSPYLPPMVSGRTRAATVLVTPR